MSRQQKTNPKRSITPMQFTFMPGNNYSGPNDTPPLAITFDWLTGVFPCSATIILETGTVRRFFGQVDRLRVAIKYPDFLSLKQQRFLQNRSTKSNAE